MVPMVGITHEVGKRMRYGTNGACRTHGWFVKAMFGSVEKDPTKINVPGPRIFNSADEDPSFGFSADGRPMSCPCFLMILIT